VQNTFGWLTCYGRDLFTFRDVRHAIVSLPAILPLEAALAVFRLDATRRDSARPVVEPMARRTPNRIFAP
jgi:hypothetical protein